MRLLVTAEAASSGEIRDAIVAYSATSTVGDLESVLQQQFGSAAPTPTSPTSSTSTAAGASTRRTGRLPGLARLDPKPRSPRPGSATASVVGLGGPSRHREREPQGLVEVRVSSGRAPAASTASASARGRSARPTLRDPGGRARPRCRPARGRRARSCSRSPPTAGDRHDRPAVAACRSRAARAAHRADRAAGQRRHPAAAPAVPPQARPQRPRAGPPGRPRRPLPLVRLDREPVAARSRGRGCRPRRRRRAVRARGASAPPTRPSPPRPPARAGLQPSAATAPAGAHPRVLAAHRAKKPEKAPIPMVMMLSPLVMSGFMYWRTGSIYSLMFMILMPIMMLLNASGTRRQQKVRYQEQLAEFHRRRADVEKAAVTSLADERGQRRSHLPRSRLGAAVRDRPALAAVGAPSLGPRLPRAAAGHQRPAVGRHRQGLHPRAARGPAALDRARRARRRAAGAHRRAGRLRPADECLSTTSWLVAQVAALHSPTDAVGLGVHRPRPTPRRGSGPSGCRTPAPSEDHPRAARLALDEDDRAAHDLRADPPRRPAQGARHRRARGAALGRRGPRRCPRAAHGARHDLAAEVRRVRPRLLHLPRPHRRASCPRSAAPSSSCTATCSTSRPPPSATSTASAATSSTTSGSSASVAPSRPSATSAPRTSARACRPPAGCSTCWAWTPPAEPTSSAAGPAAAAPRRPSSARALDGPFRIDVRADGPHGLIAGTTGSGKSELLQTIIASLAVGNRPDEFNFVLIDYKGGAAFMDCQHLPHTVGMVTDLDGHLTTRALESLGAELRRREHQLADADGEGHRGLPRGAPARRRADAAPAHHHRRVRRPRGRAARLRHGPGRRRPTRPLARRAPDPGHPAAGRRRQRRDQVQHQPAHRPARHRRERLRRRHRVEGRRRDPQVVPRPGLRAPGPLVAHAVPELARRRPPGRRRARRAARRAASASTSSWRRRRPAGGDEEDVVDPHRPGHPRRRGARGERR